MNTRAAKHSKASMEHGTSAAAVDLARYTLGGIDLDPASSSYWNRYTVKATRFYDRRANGLVQPWSGRVFVNPPGADAKAKTDTLVRPFWERLVEHWMRGALVGAFWWGYSLEQLQVLQSSPWDPSRCITLILGKREAHLVRPKEGGPPIEGESPVQANYATLIPSRAHDVALQQRARFVERGSRLGRIVRPL